MKSQKMASDWVSGKKILFGGGPPSCSKVNTLEIGGVVLGVDPFTKVFDNFIVIAAVNVAETLRSN